MGLTMAHFPEFNRPLERCVPVRFGWRGWVEDERNDPPNVVKTNSEIVCYRIRSDAQDHLVNV